MKEHRKSNAGAPKAVINWREVDALLEAGCSGAEVASSIGLNKATIYDRCMKDNGIQFSKYSQQKREKGNSILRAKQYQVAIEDGDKTMLVWLGKNRLDQSDKKETKVDLSGNIEIDI